MASHFGYFHMPTLDPEDESVEAHAFGQMRGGDNESEEDIEMESETDACPIEPATPSADVFAPTAESSDTPPDGTTEPANQLHPGENRQSQNVQADKHVPAEKNTQLAPSPQGVSGSSHSPPQSVSQARTDAEGDRLRQRLAEVTSKLNRQAVALGEARKRIRELERRLDPGSIDGRVITLLACRLAELAPTSHWVFSNDGTQCSEGVGTGTGVKVGGTSMAAGASEMGGNEIAEISAALLDEVERSDDYYKPSPAGGLEVVLEQATEEGLEAAREKWGQDRERRLYNLEGVVHVLRGRVEGLERGAEVAARLGMGAGLGLGMGLGMGMGMGMDAVVGFSESADGEEEGDLAEDEAEDQHAQDRIEEMATNRSKGKNKGKDKGRSNMAHRLEDVEDHVQVLGERVDGVHKAIKRG